ncbi:MAG: chemotaxis protein CheW [Candidatus Gastranaerophilales bacterium]|nr:chemotaxis protein CheW [Candidatus Gastranaerophilales bacterium]
MSNNLILNELNALETIKDNSENYTLIEINQRKYAIKTNEVLEIIKVMELDYSHQMPSFVLGIIKFEQIPIGVIDLREVFKKERIVYDLSAKIIVIKTQKSYSAIICDKVCDITKLNKDIIQEIPYQQDANFFDGLYSKNDENIYILNVDNILDYTIKYANKFENQENKIKYIVDDEESKEVLKSRKDFLIKVTTEVQNQKALYDSGVTFAINDVKYYINMASVKEFYKVNNSKFIKVPNTEDYIFGLVNIKGEYITVLDLRRFFNNSKTTLKEKSTIIILNSEEFRLGILADEICESLDVDFDEIIQNRLQKQDENKMMEFVKDNEIYQVLDVEKLFQDERLTIA